MRDGFARVAKDTSGATAIEYGLFAVLLGFMLVAGTPFMRNATVGTFGELCSSDGAGSMRRRFFIGHRP
jgi:Flp pilus assembly pilin Flp